MKYWLLIVSLFIFACTNSDDYLYNENDVNEVTISAQMALDIDSISIQIKADTVQLGDTIIFIAEVKPSKSIRLQHYYWTLDGEHFASEFSFRRAITKPGHHKVALVLIDYFGDTLSDTLQIWVTKPPLLNENVFIPANGSQGLPTQGGISFAWNAYDPDSIYKVHNHFTLTDFRGDILVDTIVPGNVFTYNEPLQPLKRYDWQVSAINELGMPSNDSLSGHFFTQGVLGESGITGSVQIKELDRFFWSCLLSIYDTTGQLLQTDTINHRSARITPFLVSPVKAGNYQISISLLNHPHYQSNLKKISLRENEIKDIGNITLIDTIKPSIDLIGAHNGDTIDFADTLFFTYDSLEDKYSYYRTAQIDGQTIDIKIKDNQLYTVIPRSFQSFRHTLLTVTAKDRSNNETVRNYYIRPSLKWFTCNSDTTLGDSTILKIFIEDQNPYGFVPEVFLFSIFKDSNPIAAGYNGQNSYSFLITSALFPDSVNYMRTGIRYTNGITQWSDWTVYRKFGEGGNE